MANQERIIIEIVDQQKGMQIITGIDALILVIKASGGYKSRAMIRVQDGKDFDMLVTLAEAELHCMADSLKVAEAMLHEPAPSMIHPRWEEYQDRLAELHTRHQAVAKTRDGPTTSLGVEAGNRTIDRSTEPADKPGGNLPV